MEFLEVETISPLKETNPFLLSWVRSGRAIEFLFLKRSGERTKIYSGKDNEEFLRKAGWKFSERNDFNKKGVKIFIKGDPHFLKFGNENYADKIVELLNEEASGFLRMSIRQHYFQTTREHVTKENQMDRKLHEVKGWKIVLNFENRNLGNYLCHIFSSPKVQTRTGKIGLKSPVIAWWEIHQFIPTKTHSLDKGDVKIGSTANRGDVFINSKTSPHTLIVGSSGAGKSSMIIGTMNYILKNRLGKVILVDPHGDTAKKMEGSNYRRYVISPDSQNSLNLIGTWKERGTAYRVAEDFVSILRSSRELQYTDPLVGPRMEDLITRGISLLADIKGMTLVDFYNILRDARIRDDLKEKLNNRELREYLDEIGRMSAEEKASTERAIGRLVNDPIIRSLVCDPKDDGTLMRIISEVDILIFDLERSSLGYEDSRLLSNILTLYVWITISTIRKGDYFLFLEEGQDYQSALIGDVLSSGRKFGLKVFFITTSFKSISDTAGSLLFSNTSNYIFMKLTEPDKIKIREFTGIELELPDHPFEFLLVSPEGQEKGSVEPVLFPNETRQFKAMYFDYLTDGNRKRLSSEIDSVIQEMKKSNSIYFIFEEFCEMFKEYDRSEVIAMLKEKIARDGDIHFVGRVTIDSGNFRGRHECFQVRGRKQADFTVRQEVKVTSDLISNILEKK
ncbi:MAG: DUF87 domain-containing protein [Thermoplasmatales archaeon]